MRIDFMLPKDERYHQFCLFCHSENIHRVFIDERSNYLCENCQQQSPRLLVIDPEIVWWVDKETKEYWHDSAGVLVINRENKVLLFERLLYPFALSIPAGHVNVKETPEDAAKRELYEETGIATDQISLFSSEDVSGDECRRGADHHRWHLYTTKINNLNLDLKLNDEGANPVWLDLDHAMKQNLVYPIRFFISKYGKELLTRFN